MEIIENRYYQPTRINNTTYLIMMFIEMYFGKEIFKNEGNRIFYGSDEFAFRQRLNTLYPSLATPYIGINAVQMQFPFANYFRNSGWRIDSRPAIQNATAAIKGFDISNEISVPIRFLQTEMDFSLTFYFTRDDDAQNCYDILMWIQNPTPKQFAFPGLMYKNYKLDLPIIMHTKNITWTNQFKENDWLQKNRIIVVKADLTVKSVVLDQYAQGDSSTLFEILPQESEIGKFYITKECILDYLSFKGDPLIDKDNIVMDIIANFTPDPELNPVINTTDITQTSVNITWDYNEEALPLYEEEVLIVLDNGTQYKIPITDKLLTITGLDSESTYNYNIYFYSKSGSIIKRTGIFATSLPTDKLELKGMIGLEF